MTPLPRLLPSRGDRSRGRAVIRVRWTNRHGCGTHDLRKRKKFQRPQDPCGLGAEKINYLSSCRPKRRAQARASNRQKRACRYNSGQKCPICGRGGGAKNSGLYVRDRTRRHRCRQRQALAGVRVLGVGGKFCFDTVNFCTVYTLHPQSAKELRFPIQLCSIDAVCVDIGMILRWNVSVLP